MLIVEKQLQRSQPDRQLTDININRYSTQIFLFSKVSFVKANLKDIKQTKKLGVSTSGSLSNYNKVSIWLCLYSNLNLDSNWNSYKVQSNAFPHNSNSFAFTYFGRSLGRCGPLPSCHRRLLSWQCTLLLLCLSS